MPLSPREMQEAIIRNLPERTGRSLAEWVAATLQRGPSARAERIRWLKTSHGLGHIQAQVIAQHAEGAGNAYGNTGALLDALLPAGGTPRVHYTSLCAALAERQCALETVPCKTYVGLRVPGAGGLQIAVVKPLADALLVGLAVPPALLDPLMIAPDASRLAPARRGLGGSSRITRELEIHGETDVDAATGWIQFARHAAAVRDARRAG